MANTEIFKEITKAEMKESEHLWNFVPVTMYAGMVPVEDEVGSLVNIRHEKAESILRTGRVDGATIERLIVRPNA